MDMRLVVDQLEDDIEKIADNRDLTLQEDFNMNTFFWRQDQIETFDEYLTFIFQDKMGIAVSGSVVVEDKAIPFDFYGPTYFIQQISKTVKLQYFAIDLQKKLLQQCLLSCETTQMQLCSSTTGKYSRAVISEDEGKEKREYANNGLQ